MRASTRLLAGALAATAVAAVLAAPRVSSWRRERALSHAPRPLSVLLVTLDTTRADRLGCYGHAGGASPRLDALARQGVLFRQAYAHVPLTCPSHASILTGRLPPGHGVRDNGGYVLGPELPTLAERFAAAGHRTGAFVSAFVLDRRFGLARGFGTYHDQVPSGSAADQGDPSRRAVRAQETVDRALRWLGQEPGRPFFLWVHLFDPHHPYEPPEPYASRFRAEPYLGEIAYTDAQAGRLFEAAAQRRALVAVMGDHGEGLGDHEEVTHGYFVYSNTQRVPLLLSLPGVLPQATSVDGVVRGVDLAPTLLDLAGLPGLPGVDGASLRAHLSGRRTGDAGPAYVESYHPRFWWGAQELLGVRSGRWLFVEAPRPELYDVRADPSERTNVAASHPAQLDELRQRLRGFNAGGAPTAAGARLDAETERRLRALGYLGAGAAPPGGPLPDAKDNGPMLAAVTRGHELLERGRPQEALAAFEEALAKNPRAASVRSRRAETLLALGRLDDAFSAYAENAEGRADEESLLGMARVREQQGRKAEALALLRTGLEALPGSTALRLRAGELELAAGDAAGAEASARAVLERAPGDGEAMALRARSLARRGRGEEANAVWLELAEGHPLAAPARQAAEPLASWADALLASGQLEPARRAYEAALGTGFSNDRLHLNLALTLWRLQRKDDALAVLERGRARHPESPDLHYRVARLLEGRGRRAEAAAAYRRALELAPGRKDAADALQRLGS
jgi:arylsulfatase A-like enzyme/tetratricopeptide (TPR) repeat protein